MNDTLEAIITRNDTWRGCRKGAFAGGPANDDAANSAGLHTGYSTLNAALRQKGWPLDSAIEVLSDGCGLGAMGLFLPAMEKLSEQQRWQVFIAPPFIPYAPLLAARGIDTQQILLVHPQNRQDLLWATEQALRSTTCGAVFSWLGAGQYRYSELRKLQLAATGGDTLSVLFRPLEAGLNSAPAGLRLQMREYRQVHILKQRGGIQGIDVDLPPAEDIPDQPQLWELPSGNTSSSNVATGIDQMRDTATTHGMADREWSATEPDDLAGADSWGSPVWRSADSGPVQGSLLPR